MHSIKILFRQLRFGTFWLIPAAALLAQPATPADSKNNPGEARKGPVKTKAEIPPPGGESRELANARLELDMMLHRFDEKHPEVIAQRSRIALLEKLEPRKINLDFPGGPLKKFISTISNVEGISVSIITAGDVDDFFVTLPAFSLRNATLITVMEVVRNLLPQSVAFEPTGQLEPNAGVWVLRSREVSRPKSAPSDFQSFQLAPYLGDQSIDDIISAIRAAWELDPKHDKDALRLKYHPATSILLVSGQPDEGRAESQAISMTRNVLSQLKHSAPKGLRPVPGTPPSDPEKP